MNHIECKTGFCVAVLTAFCLALTISCGRSNVSQSDINHIQAIDSTSRSISNLDSLKQFTDSLAEGGDKVGEIIALKHLGKMYRNNSMFEQAIECHNKGLDIACELADTVEIIRALNNLGTNYRRIGIMDEATSFHYRALSYCEQYSDKKSWDAKKNRVISLNGIGNIYMTIGDYNAADTVLRQALEGERELESALGQAINYANLGAIMEHRNQADSAWTYYRKSLEQNEIAGSQLGIALNHASFGDLYEKAGKPAKAIEEFKIAYNLMKDSDDMWHWLNASEALARIYLKQGDLVTAAIYIKQSDSVATAINSIGHRADVAYLKYQLADAQGKDREALKHFVEFNNYQSQISSEDGRNHLQNMRVKLERERRQAEIDFISKSYKNERIVKNVFIALLIVVFLLAAVTIAFLLYSLRMRSRNTKLMNKLEQNRSEFFTNITHEFRTPLTVILGLSEQLQEDDEPQKETIRRRAAIISRQGNNLLQLINQLLDISKVKSAIGTPDWKRGNIVAFISMITESYQEMCAQKRIELSFVSAESEINMDFAPHYIKRVVDNLISNSIKFTAAYGKIYVTTKREDDKLVLTVADNGRGIDPEDLPHIFDAFYQGKAVADGNMGTGIGLSLVNQIVKACGGEITVYSALNDGTIFTVRVPLKHNKDKSGEIDFANLKHDSRSIIAPVETPVNDDNGLNNKKRILVVEDHSDVSYYIGSILEDKYSVYYARTGQEGIDKAKEILPDLIVTDLMMPEMDGLEMSQAIRNSELLSHIPIVVITAKTSEEDRIKGIETGVDAYLNKPFNKDELRVLISNLIKQRKLLLEKFRHKDSATHSDAPQTSANQQLLDKFVSLVYANIKTGDLSIDNLASQMAMTSSQLRRKIHSITGVNPATYISNIRMSRARNLLETHPDMPIGDVALECGFYDMAHFSRIFKQIYGMSPTRYRKEHAQEE